MGPRKVLTYTERFYEVTQIYRSYTFKTERGGKILNKRMFSENLTVNVFLKPVLIHDVASLLLQKCGSLFFFG